MQKGRRSGRPFRIFISVFRRRLKIWGCFWEQIAAEHAVPEPGGAGIAGAAEANFAWAAAERHVRSGDSPVGEGLECPAELLPIVAQAANALLRHSVPAANAALRYSAQAESAAPAAISLLLRVAPDDIYLMCCR